MKIHHHPGRILRDKFLNKLEISQQTLCEAISVPISRINEIVRARRRITANTDLRLSKYLGTEEGYWLNLQNLHDLSKERSKLTKKALQIIRHPKV